MSGFFSWYVLITLLGWITFPLAYRLFPALCDRGYSLSRALGLLIWAYIFWLCASLGLAQNDMGGLLLGLAIVGGLSAWAFLTVDRRPQTVENAVNRLHLHRAQVPVLPMVEWLKENKSLIFTTEILFFLAFALMAFIRSANPEIVGTEKPMELMMIHGTLNSPTFPPRDLWLSGYSISYYYFGYVMASMLAMFTGVPATMAFNLMIALVFALSAVGAYGILYNLLGLYAQDRRPQTADEVEGASGDVLSGAAIWKDQPSVVMPLLAPLFLLLVSNVEGFLEALHARGFFWKDGPNFWTWLDIPELRDAPLQPLGWIPERFWWWCGRVALCDGFRQPDPEANSEARSGDGPAQTG